MSATANEGYKDSRFRVEVSRDHITAYLHVSPSVKQGGLSAREIRLALASSRITQGIKDNDRIETFLENLDLYDHTLIVASGKAFTQGEDARIEFLFETDARVALEDDLRPSDSVDFRKVGRIASVRKGDVVARKIPATQGEEGVTIYGQKLPGEWGTDVTLTAGPGASLSKNGLEYIAELSGAPILTRGVLRVDPVQIIDGDVDYGVGDIDFNGTVAIRGSILDGFTVRAAGDIIVDNTVQAATVEAGGDIVVRRGILTRSKTTVRAEGSVYARFIENSIVESEGDIVVENAILNSDVRCNGSVVALAGEGSIIGGQVIAFDRILARKIGSEAHAGTHVQAGYRHEVQKQYLDALARLKAVQKQMADVKKNYDYVSGSSGDIDKLGDLRGQGMKLLKLQKQLQEEITEINNNRVFNQYAAIEIETGLYPGALVFLGDARYNVKKPTGYAAIKWDSEEKTIYLTTFDEAGRGQQKKPSARARTVLIIDDSKAVRKTLRMILERMDLRVIAEAEDGSEGVALFKQHKPHLVTCDIAMVNMDGVEALKKIQAINPKARVIMISSNRDKKKVLDCVMAGARDYILKPFVPRRVLTVIRTTLEN